MNGLIKSVFIAGALLLFTILPSTSSSKKNGIFSPPSLFTKEGELVNQVVIPLHEIEAKSVLALNLLTGKIIFEKNPHELLPLASLTKIISSLVVLDHIAPDEYIEVTKSAIETPEPSTLHVGEHLRVEDLLAMAIGESSNDAIMALVKKFGDEKWFLELMRQKAEELGARTTNFLNPTGLDIKLGLDQQLTQTEFGSNFGSAYDLAQIIKNSLDSIIWQIDNKEEVVSKEGIRHKIKHTNILRKELTGIYGAKTGFTDNAGGNLVLIVEKPLEKPKLIIILGSGLEGRFEDAKKIVTLIK